MVFRCGNNLNSRVCVRVRVRVRVRDRDRDREECVVHWTEPCYLTDLSCSKGQAVREVLSPPHVHLSSELRRRLALLAIDRKHD